MTYRLIAATTLRNHLSDALKAVIGSKKLLLITRKNKPVSAIMDIDFLEDLLAAASPEYVKSVREAREDYKNGRVFSHAQVFGDL
ncbi:MAG: type II toxin-antitoxin system Phd/YefM family antitoxin [Elusimicrobia bacterium]|nr:type II toxin-antitoxin system Phd/YefM family antitoxin [Elusimicrobiota bacterium]